jgi:tetratricopeptide (TPR) repeat protein
MRSLRVALLLGASLSAVGCATAISGSADNVTRLEKARAADPRSSAAQRALGIAYFKAGRYADARAALEQATSMDQRDGVAALYLGLTAEAQDDLAGAEHAYQSYLAIGKTRATKNRVRDRLEAIKLKRVQADAKLALARESQLAATAGPPNTVAVMPFRFSGADTSLKPIERGFAELVTTDLSRVSRLTVLERERLQVLLDEIELQQQHGAAEGTGVRAGKILQVGKMVGGSIQQQGDELQANAIVTDLATTSIGTPARDQRSLDELFTLEKNIVLGLLQSMGVVPTTAERNAIEQRPTRSLAAFLAYSRGLELADQGRFDDASRAFDNAVRIDPGFAPAARKSQEVKSAAIGQSQSAAAVEASLRGVEGAAVNILSQGATVSATLGGGASAIADGLNPSTAGGATTGGGSATTQPQVDASAGTGGDNPSTKTGRLTIVIKQPGKP